MPLLRVEHWDFLLEGIFITIQVTGGAAIVGTVIGVLGGIASLSQLPPLRWLMRVYVEVFRGASALILLFWAFFALPELFGISISAMQAGILALGTNMGAYCTELARGAIQAVPRGQSEAALAVNLNAYQRIRYVTLPQAVITMLPPYGNLLIEVLKASALVSLIALDDLMRQANILRNNRVDSTVDIYTAVIILYFLIAAVITVMVRAAELYFSKGMDVGRAGRKEAK